jgi:O-antigen/teichoic acid export membrane protein
MWRSPCAIFRAPLIQRPVATSCSFPIRRLSKRSIGRSPPIRRAAIYVATFAVARGSLFAAPLVVANLVPLEFYGRIEFTQSIASVLTLVLGFGLPATVPLILLREEVAERWDTLLLLMLCIAGFSAATGWAIAIYYRSVLVEGTLIALFTSLLMLQGYWATVLKAHDRSTPAVILEGGLWFVIVLAAISAVAAGNAWFLVPLAAAAYSAALFVYTLRRCVAVLRPFDLRDLWSNLRLGLPLVATGVLSTLLGALGRVTIGVFGSDLAVANYAILFRATAVALVAHQLLIIGLFRSLYVWEVGMLQQRSPLIVLGVSAAVVIFQLLAGPMGWMLGPAFAKAWEQYWLVGSLILVQTLLWSGIAVNDLLTARFGIAVTAARWGGWVLLVGVPVFLAIVLPQDAGDTLATLRGTVLAHFALLIAYYLVQCAVISRNGHNFGRLWGLTLTSVLILSGVVAAVAFA